MHADVDELTALLKDNLDKVVQHGKRADSIACCSTRARDRASIIAPTSMRSSMRV
jgi:hypothetical protein